MTDSTEDKPQTSTLQGKIPPLATTQERNAALDEAFDYRGDVTIETTDGRIVEGYIFDRRNEIAEPYVRILPKDSDDRVTVKYSEITRLIFSGRDTAAGKSWETWVKKYNEKKAKGEEASIHSDPLE